MTTSGVSPSTKTSSESVYTNGTSDSTLDQETSIFDYVTESISSPQKSSLRTPSSQSKVSCIIMSGLLCRFFTSYIFPNLTTRGQPLRVIQMLNAKVFVHKMVFKV